MCVWERDYIYTESDSLISMDLGKTIVIEIVLLRILIQILWVIVFTWASSLPSPVNLQFPY